jgi:isoaspartyl peptidase/L-asparaginase-like protein (Ntn-hydrolase superfamily)
MVQLSFTGTREGVIKQIQAAKEADKAADKAQLENVKAYLIDEVKALPAKFNGCRVDAHGQANEGGRSLQCTIVPLSLHV